MDGKGEDAIPYAKYLTTNGTKEISTLSEVKKRLGLDTDSEEDTTPTPDPSDSADPTEAPDDSDNTTDPTEAPDPGDDNNSDGNNTRPTDSTIQTAEGYIGRSLDDLISAIGDSNSSEYDEDPDNGTSGYYYYGNFTVSTTVDADGNEVAGYDYDTDGNLSERSVAGANLTTVYAYDYQNRLTTLTNQTQSARVISKYNSEYLTNGQKSKEISTVMDKEGKNTAKTATYTYDLLGRITKETKTGSEDISYTYDNHNNRKEMKVGNTILSFSAKTKKTPQQMSVPTRQAPMKPPNPYAGAMSSAGDTNTMLYGVGRSSGQSR